MKTALMPGTFDPPTLGHIDIIQRASLLFDKLYIGIAMNPTKKNKSLFSLNERVEMLKAITSSFRSCEVVSFSSLVVEYAKQMNIAVLVRGLRAFSDFEFEFRMALANRHLSGIETLFFMADERTAHISSTLIRELIDYRARLSEFVPKEVEEKVYAKFISPHSFRDL